MFENEHLVQKNANISPIKYVFIMLNSFNLSIKQMW
jgi:hypothetical protein